MQSKNVVGGYARKTYGVSGIATSFGAGSIRFSVSYGTYWKERPPVIQDFLKELKNKWRGLECCRQVTLPASPFLRFRRLTAEESNSFHNNAPSNVSVSLANLKKGGALG